MKVCANRQCEKPWVRKGTKIPLTGRRLEDVGEPQCLCVWWGMYLWKEQGQ